MPYGENAIAIEAVIGSPARRRPASLKSKAKGSVREGKGLILKPAIRLGVLLGICFSFAGVSWLLLANRVPYLDQFAYQRNLALGIAFAGFGLVPTCRFRKFPQKNFLCGIIAWVILSATYSAAEVQFPGLASRMSAFHLFVLGGAILGLLAASAWVVNVAIACRKAS